jgi:hypothetical protein
MIPTNTVHPIVLSSDIDSLRELEFYLEKKNLTLATNLEVDAIQLHKLACPDWKKKPQGAILLFVIQDITQEKDETSPVGKRIAPRKGEEPVLSKFLSSMCSPFSFVTDDVIPKGQVVFVKARPVAQAA